MTFYTKKLIHTNYESLKALGLEYNNGYIEVETPCGTKGNLYADRQGFSQIEEPGRACSFRIGASTYEAGCIILKYLLSLNIEKPYEVDPYWGEEYYTKNGFKAHDYRLTYVNVGKINWVKNEL